MDELMNQQSLEDLRICDVLDSQQYYLEYHPWVAVENMEKLLNFVSYISNEPTLNIFVDEFGGPQHSVLLKWMEGKMFSFIWISRYLPIYDQLLRNHMSRREYPSVYIVRCNNSGNALADLLKSGHSKDFGMEYRGSHVFSTDVAEGIIENFLARPQEFASGFRVSALFDEASTLEMLRKMEKEGLCTVYAILGRFKGLRYDFIRENVNFSVSNYFGMRFDLA